MQIQLLTFASLILVVDGSSSETAFLRYQTGLIVYNAIAAERGKQKLHIRADIHLGYFGQKSIGFSPSHIHKE